MKKITVDREVQISEDVILEKGDTIEILENVLTENIPLRLSPLNPSVSKRMDGLVMQSELQRFLSACTLMATDFINEEGFDEEEVISYLTFRVMRTVRNIW